MDGDALAPAEPAAPPVAAKEPRLLAPVLAVLMGASLALPTLARVADGAAEEEAVGAPKSAIEDGRQRVHRNHREREARKTACMPADMRKAEGQKDRVHAE